MKRHFAFGDRHPRWIAGLWFSTSLVGARLILNFAFALMAPRAVLSRALPNSQLPTYALLLLAAGCIGGHLGSGLLAPGMEPAEVVRRGAWIGLLTGVVFTPLGAAAQWAVSLGKPRDPAWVGGTLIALQACFLAGWLLPVGVVAAWCFVRLGGPTERSSA